jgi:class 3 adenylate cyclase
MAPIDGARHWRESTQRIDLSSRKRNVYADMVGYSRLIGLDDLGMLERMRALRRNLIDPAIEEHRGRIVQTGRDSFLMVFDSIDGADDRNQPPIVPFAFE